MGGPQHHHQQHHHQRRSRFYSKFHLIVAFLVGCCFATAAISVFHLTALSTFHDASIASSTAVSVHRQFHSSSSSSSSSDASASGKQSRDQPQKEEAQPSQKLAANHDNFVHPVAGLDCSEHEGPALSEDAAEMVYWRDIQGDNGWKSPFKKDNERQYLTFEPDGGGWNNIRMSMETVLTMALAMGRVLVLPPSQKMYLLGQTTFNFADFFPLQEMAEEHPGLEIITTQEFLEETMGKTTSRITSEVVYPPHKKTAWDGDTTGIKQVLGPWLRSIALNPDWDPAKCVAAFPRSSDPADTEALLQAFDDLLSEEGGKYVSKSAYKEFVNNPTPVDAPFEDRLREFLSERKKICVYDKAHQDAKIIHFHGKTAKVLKQHNKVSTDGGGRLLVHFYAFLFFQDWKTDLWMKRFVRDHVRYIDNIQCAAARIVHKLRTEHGGAYDSFHVRRGDFQYKKTRVDASVIVDKARDVIEKGRVVYVGTDERNKKFFDPFVEDAGWKVLFLDDFVDVVGTNINPNYYGMIDQLVVSRGERFFGCWFSTFSGYIMRLRGYHSQLEMGERGPNAVAFGEGKLPNSYYYALDGDRDKMHDYWPVKPVFYAREFPISWRAVDVD